MFLAHSISSFCFTLEVGTQYNARETSPRAGALSRVTVEDPTASSATVVDSASQEKRFTEDNYAAREAPHGLQICGSYYYIDERYDIPGTRYQVQQFYEEEYA